MSVGGFFALNKTKDSKKRFSAVDSYMTKRVQCTRLVLHYVIIFSGQELKIYRWITKIQKSFFEIAQKKKILLHLCQ